MDIRKEIEGLAVWFVLATMLMLLLTFLTKYNGIPNTAVLSEPLTIGSLLKFLASYNLLIGYVDNIAVAGWLFHRTKICGYNKWLWTLFGLAGSLIGGALYLLVRVYESCGSGTSNQSNQQGPEAGMR